MARTMTCTINHEDATALPRPICRRCNPAPTDTMTPAERAAHYAAIPLTDPYRGGNLDARLERDRLLRARAEHDRTVKRDISREKFLAEKAAAGEVYHRKMKLWVKV